MKREPLCERIGNRWREILPRLGVDSRYLTGKNVACPICRAGKDRFRFINTQGHGTWVCTHCGGGDGVALIMRATGKPFEAVLEEVEPMLGEVKPERPRKERIEDDKRRMMALLWKQSRAIASTDAAGLYLTRRLGITTYPPTLRGLETLKYPGGIGESPRFFPAMLALVTGADGTNVNLVRLYLTQDGQKAPVDAPRKMMPGTMPDGCAVRLAPAAEVMGIAEGVETAIAASILHDMPVWAAVSALGLERWTPPRQCRRIVVFGDNDESYTGQAAAYALAHRLRESHAVEVRIPGHRTTGEDWDDVRRSMRPVLGEVS